jgi:hypothetical protein
MNTIVRTLGLLLLVGMLAACGSPVGPSEPTDGGPTQDGGGGDTGQG